VFDAPGEGGHQPDAVLVCGEPVPETLAKPRWHGAGELKEQPASRPKADRPHSDDLAYILYTSGSTGLPKGVMLSQENATSYVDWCSEVFAPTPDDRFTSHAPFHFDLSILDLYVPAKHGAALYLISEELGKTAASLGPFIDEHRITCWYSVPSILALMTQYGKLEETDASSLRIVNFAGEVFPIKYLRRLRDLWPHADFYNLYGPTETNVCTYYKIPATIPPDRQEPYPIGKICSHCEALIIGDDGKPVADGGEGLLCIAGTPVLQGYWGDEQRTDGAFMTHGGRRYYNTGDVVRPDENGDFVFLGRKDRMVKRHGYRIELGEIEAAMYKHPGVAEAAAIALLDGAGVVTLRAVLSAKDGAKLGAIAMKQHSAAHLPSYMIPDTFTFLDALPQTSTGKIDYQALIRQAGGG
jgi:amino acid adenylation domain-containing protein